MDDLIGYISICLYLFFIMLIIGVVFAMLKEFIFKDKKASQKKEKEKLRTIFSTLVIGLEYAEVIKCFGDCGRISAPNLVSEILLPNGANRKVYIWYLDWDYVISKSSGVGMMPIHTQSCFPE